MSLRKDVLFNALTKEIKAGKRTLPELPAELLSDIQQNTPPEIVANGLSTVYEFTWQFIPDQYKQYFEKVEFV